MNSDPHIVIDRHPELGIVAANRHNTAVIDHVLHRVGFQPLPDRPQLYALLEPERDGLRRVRQAVQSLRIARYRVATDAGFEPGTTPPRHSSGRTHHRGQATAGAYAHARALTSHIAADRLVPHDRIPEVGGTLRPIGPDTGEGVLLHHEGHPQHLETRLADADSALAAFAYVSGDGRPIWPPASLPGQRAQAATAISPARSAVGTPARPVATPWQVALSRPV
ncbi:hypothetical protein [Streptomyces hygroscopicus]|uniref:hypothetical protein n=1 Tax=Streptomyces hygroscopicus TaxID=1912 RepID=UPI0007674501|nr:hypothetical protein [Streptomyces hygroscopicus]